MLPGPFICHICYEKCVYLYSISKSGSDDIKYIEKLRICVPSQQWGDVFSICKNCVEKLDSAYEFVQLCLRSQENRTEKLSLPEKAKDEAQNRDEVVNNFTCFECNKSFRLKRTLGLHLTRIHVKPKKNNKRATPIIKEELAKVLDSIVDDAIKTENEAPAYTATESSDPASGIERIFGFEKRDTIKRDPKDLSDYESDHDLISYCSEDEIVKTKKLYKGKKRGPKLKGPQRCHYCELEFSRSDRYIHHIRSKHTFEKPFKCELCDVRYYSQHNLNIHMRKHRNEKPFVCSTCGKCFVSSNDLWQHNKIHDKIRQYGCDECERSFKTHSNLRTHKLQMHQDPGMWKFVCTVCGKKFPLNNNLIKHMRRHEGKKDFECHLCEKKFVEKIDLQTHILSHSNERHFKCTLCLKEYKKKETLRRHMKIEHNLGNFVVKKPEKKLNCPMCPKIFAFNNKLQRHILTHTGEKPVKCECCDKRFRDNYDRNSHLRQVHNMEPKNAMLPV